jgi:polyvinyl alcohol dehydrogenase (cytochrome)
VWNTPTLDPATHTLYVGTGDASTYPAPATSDAILALDMRTGRRIWSRQIYPGDAFIVGCAGDGFTENCPRVGGPDWDIPMSPMLGRLPGGRALLVFGTKPGDVLALDPARGGAPVWRTNVVSGSEVTGAAVQEDARRGRDRGPLWGGAMDDSRVYFGLSGGGVVAMRLEDGQRAWYAALSTGSDSHVGHSAAATLMPGVVLAGGSDGRLWALASSDGHTLWSYDTAHAFTTVNGVPAHGGSIVSAGAVVADGLLLVGSGYGVVRDTPGNVLLAFGIEPAVP